MRIVVTGGTGKAGRWVVRDLREHDHDVLSVDVVRDPDPGGPSIVADLVDLGQAHELVAGADAVVHLAAIPAPGIRPAGETFRNNMLSTYNVFSAAVERGVRRVVWASSETVLGLPFDTPPDFVPVDESHPPRPESSYALSKLLGEVAAEQLARGSGTVFVGFRYSNIMEPADYDRFDSWQDDPLVRRWNLWSYVDIRDCASAVRRGLDADIDGADVFIVAAADTCMRRDTAGLMAEVFPDVPLRRELQGRESLLSSDRARTRLGYEPGYSWLEGR
jgi:nucleoside-diphosphate-sugar epimerase